MKTIILLGFAFTAVLSGCGKKENKNEYPQIFKENAMELLLHTKTLADGRTVFQLEKNVFVKNKQEQHLIVSSDTLPDLGREMVSEVNEDEPDVPQVAKKQYDVLFKVDSLKY
ncbi:MAG: hypothetical protein Q8916_08995 [Bacteroidota bacterium]|nr:hypothetical protein [Bacteroidota bacterium]MDP4230522.1 hypothetical protein [Bacteroidota bacterium]MDP4235525.1 hypothetical protein [Bacteroidota bacterium]